MITLEFSDQQELKKAYLPFVQNGALITTFPQKPKLGTQTEAQLILPEEDPIQFTSKIVLIQKQANGQYKVGIQLTEEISQKLRNVHDTLE